ncbi:MAG: hypothetical protein ACD_19C00023G0004, partial [uncultured bacterium]
HNQVGDDNNKACSYLLLSESETRSLSYARDDTYIIYYFYGHI